MSGLESKFRIRLAKEEDVSLIARFNFQLAFETENRELDLETLKKGVFEFFKTPAYGFYLVAEELLSGEPIGCLLITYEWSDWRNGLFFWIQSVYVLPEWRRKGVYRSLYEKVKSLAKERGGVCGYRLYVEKENTRAQKTYESLGMEETCYLMYEGN